jgi:hypothetical protein
MRWKSLLLATALVMGASMPAGAAVVGVSDIDLAAGSFTYLASPDTSFTFTYDSRYFFDTDPFAVRTSGTGEVRAFGGFLGIPLSPSQDFADRGVKYGPDEFGQYASFTDTTRIPASLSAGDLGLRYTVGADTYYGYARTEGSRLVSFGFETQANTAILSGSFTPAVPEPASWALMIGGMGVAGGALRVSRRRIAIAA